MSAPMIAAQLGPPPAHARAVEGGLAQLTATRAHLHQLFWARNAVLGVALVAIAADSIRDGALPPGSLVGLVALAALVNGLTAWRLRQGAEVSYREFLVQVLADVTLIAAAIQQTGGSESGLAELNFIPLTIAAATLPGRMTAVVFALVVVVDEIVCHYIPGALWPDPSERRIDLLVGGIIAVFVFCMARTSRAHGARVAQAREQYMRARQAAALDSLAVSVVHQLASPLATMAVALGELRSAVGAAHAEPLALLEGQVRACKKISAAVLASTGAGRAEAGGRVAADRFLAGIVEKYALMHPWTSVECRHEGDVPVPEIVAESSLEDALLVLLLGHSAPRRAIRIAHRWTNDRLTLHICDGESAGAAGHPDYLLAMNTIGRFGGTVAPVNEPSGATCVEVSLPLKHLSAQEA